jgi:hypothetical protein
MNRRFKGRMGQVTGGSAMLVVLVACGQAQIDPGTSARAQLGTAVSPPGLTCGVLDKSHVADIFGVDEDRIGQMTALEAFPENSQEFTSVRCSVNTNSGEKSELLVLSVYRTAEKTEPQEQEFQKVKAKAGNTPDSLTFPALIGEGTVASGIGGTLSRVCPDGKGYSLVVSTSTGKGSATKWLRLINSAIPSVDDLGACP